MLKERIAVQEFHTQGLHNGKLSNLKYEFNAGFNFGIFYGIEGNAKIGIQFPQSYPTKLD